MRFLQLIVVLCQISLAAENACADPAPPDTGDKTPHGVESMSREQLEQKARRLQAIVEEKTLQAHGLIPMFVRADDYQLPTAEDYRGAYKHRHLRDKTEAEIGIPPMHIWRAWEDTPADTAAYLGAMAYQYRCTQAPQALAICRRTLRGIQYIHDLAVEKGERGFLCKPYGGVYSNQTSGDQVQSVVVGLAAYLPIAPPEDVAIIDELIRDFADHQIAVDYQALHGYFAYPRDSSGWKNWNWSYGVIYAPLMHLAWNSSGDPKYLDEIHRWYKHCGLDKKQPPLSGKKIRGPGNGRMLNLPSLLMEFDPDEHELWRSFMFDCFRKSQPEILADGTSYWSWEYDAETKELKPLEAGIFGTVVRSGRLTAGAAVGCVMAQRWFPKEDMAGFARIVIERLDEPTFRFIMPASPGEELLPKLRIEGRLLDHDALTAWLWAYWEGRWRGYW